MRSWRPARQASSPHSKRVRVAATATRTQGTPRPAAGFGRLRRATLQFIRGARSRSREVTAKGGDKLGAPRGWLPSVRAEERRGSSAGPANVCVTWTLASAGTAAFGRDRLRLDPAQPRLVAAEGCGRV